MLDVEILANINYNAVLNIGDTTVASPINSSTSTPLTQGKASRAAVNTGSQGSEQQTENGVAETQATGDRLNLSATAIQLSAEPGEGAIKSADEAAQVASTLKGLINSNPAQAIAAQSGS